MGTNRKCQILPLGLEDLALTALPDSASNFTNPEVRGWFIVSPKEHSMLEDQSQARRSWFHRSPAGHVSSRGSPLSHWKYLVVRQMWTCELKITVNNITPMTVTIVRIKSLRIQTEATCERVKENLMSMLFIIRLWNFRQNQLGFALTNRGKLEAKSRKRRRGDLILPIAAAAHEQLGICPAGIL